MKLHKDGTIEGTPEEVAAYIKQTPGSLRDKNYIIQRPPVNVASESEGVRQQREYGKAFTLQEKYINGVRHTRVNDGPWKENHIEVRMQNNT